MSTALTRLDRIADIGFKLFSIVAICFGGLRYFQEREEAARNDALGRSLSYIEDYGSKRYVDARLTLYDFWTDRPMLVKMLTSGGISDRVYHAALNQDVFRAGEDVRIREALVLLDNLYSQIAFCHSTGLCDAKVLTEFFCPVARSEAIAYGPFFSHMAAGTGDSDLGRELEGFARDCGAAG